MYNAISDLVLKAGSIIKVGIETNKDVKYKSNVDLVTKYDVEVENVLKEGISKILPNHTIIAEESSVLTNDRPKNAVYIDPIDGTTNFVHGFPFVAISVGVYTEGKGDYGVVYNPIMGELFTAEKEKGAYLNGHQIHVSDSDTLEKSLCATGFPYVRDNIPELMGIFEKIVRKARGIRRAGSAALDLCYTARGVFDLYYESHLKPWDIAAGMIILTEAGGKVTDFKGNEHDLKSDYIIASNGKLHEEFAKLLK